MLSVIHKCVYIHIRNNCKIHDYYEGLYVIIPL